MRRSVTLALAALLVTLVIAGCGGSPGGGGAPSPAATGELVRYERVWADGLTERTLIGQDGKVVMMHGEHLERLVLTADDLARLRTLLATPAVAGDPGGSPDRTLTYADGTVIAHARPDPGSIVELLDRLTDTHSLG